MTPMPIDGVLGRLRSALDSAVGAVLLAPPGSGKTTRVPLALLGEPWLDGRRIVVLEPRRLAARAAARFMAALLGEPVGRTVGYRVRMDSRVGPDTRIEVVTEGVLTRRLQGDPALEGVGLVVFDEFHERHLESDLGLALCLDVQGVLNPDLRILVMSATLEAAPVAELIGRVPVIACEGRQYDVETRFLGRRQGRPMEREVADAVIAAGRQEPGSILAFLPGAAEIRRVCALLESAALGAEWMLTPLFGNLAAEDQDRAIAPAPAGRRKIVLATNIAETSLTIEGIRVVVDGGLMRAPRFEVSSGMSRLHTLPVSRASADQRRGRAGRLEPGVCYRLWSEEAHGTLPARTSPEILNSDLAPLALELSVWGVVDPARLRWLDPPPEAAFRQAVRLLADLGAVESGGDATAHGRRMAALPLHPRLAHMVLSAADRGLGGAACDLAALLSERDFLRFAPGESDADLRLRLEVIAELRARGQPRGGRYQIDKSACRRSVQAADMIRRRIGPGGQGGGPRDAGRLLAWAYPDRIARRRAGSEGRYVLSGGRGAFFAAPEPLGTEEFLVAAELDGERREARIFLAAAYDRPTLLEQYEGRIEAVETVDWDPRDQAVVAVRELRLGAMVLERKALAGADPARVAAALVKGIRHAGIGCLPWTPALRRWQERVMFVRRACPEEAPWPDVSDPGLADALEQWLTPHLAGITRLQALPRVDLAAALHGLLPWRQRHRLDELAPTHLTVPSGARIRLDYSGEVPVLAVRVQEMFGCAKTPAIAGGRQPVLLHLLSPAGRPVQVTRDLSGFWSGSYHAVRKDLRGRYPKHPWPEDPLSAPPTSRVKDGGRSRPKAPRSR
jgi:ATP-dependent helicase HrpB